MGTRSLTHIYAETRSTEPQTPLLTLYRQFDGYLDGHGALISETFKGRRLVDGYSDEKRDVNGMTNAATMLIGAYYVATKEPGKPISCGNLYVTEAGAKDQGEEYTYHLYPNKTGRGFHLVVEDIYTEGKMLFDGPLDEFDPLMQEKLNV
jgi:hypothetical protein